MLREFLFRVLAPALLIVPLPTRKRIVIWIGRKQIQSKSSLSFALLPDFAENDPAGFHRFLWSHHLGHAGTYEVEQRYGKAKMEPTRRILFKEICTRLRIRRIVPERDVQSVFDAGCSLGYILRFIETDVFPNAGVLKGIDVDSYAIETGSAHLKQLGSRAIISHADLNALTDDALGEEYDIVLCFGVLMYLDFAAATRAVKVLLQHTRMLLALSTWPHPHRDNAALAESVRASEVVRNAVDRMEGVLIHNLDAMVHRAGGQVVARQWTGSRIIEGDKPLYFVLAERAS